jgi:G3E family GTPase
MRASRCLIRQLWFAGKTTVLRSWLTNAEGIRIGVVVNDVAEVRNLEKCCVKRSDRSQYRMLGIMPCAYARYLQVNIDGDLIRNITGTGAHSLVELENGCACCSLGDDVLSSIEHLIKTAKSGEPYNLIIVEVSLKLTC